MKETWWTKKITSGILHPIIWLLVLSFLLTITPDLPLKASISGIGIILFRYATVLPLPVKEAIMKYSVTNLLFQRQKEELTESNFFTEIRILQEQTLSFPTRLFAVNFKDFALFIIPVHGITDICWMLPRYVNSGRAGMQGSNGGM